jgi:hypothetical protein
VIAAGKASSKNIIPPGTVVHVKDLLKQRKSIERPRIKLGQALANTLQLRKTRDLLSDSLDE